MYRGLSCEGTDLAVQLLQWELDAYPQDVPRHVFCSVSATLLRPSYSDILLSWDSELSLSFH